MDPRQNGLAPSFLSTRFAFWRWQSSLCGLVSSARWQRDPLQLPQVSTMKDALCGFSPRRTESRSRARARCEHPGKFRIAICSNFNGEHRQAKNFYEVFEDSSLRLSWLSLKWRSDVLR